MGISKVARIQNGVVSNVDPGADRALDLLAATLAWLVEDLGIKRRDRNPLFHLAQLG